MIFKTIDTEQSPELHAYKIIGSDKRELSKLGKLNIFVGTNNSGKSRFLRGLCKISDYSFYPYGFDFDRASKLTEDCIKEMIQAFDTYGVGRIGDIDAPNFEFIAPTSLFTIKNNFLDRLDGLLRRISPNLVNAGASGVPGGKHLNSQACASTLVAIKEKYHSEVTDLIHEYKQVATEEVIRVYIPTLRGLRPPKRTDFSDLYEERTLMDYFYDNKKGALVLEKSKGSVFTGLNLYNNIRDNLLGSEEERTLVREFEFYLSKEFFEDKQVTLIPGKADDVLTIKIGDEKEKRIFDLGDGIQSIIILNYAIFSFSKLNPQNTILVFIEEPELYLHPALQRQLIERWNAYNAKNVQLFITTHSNHFLDLTIDFSNISIFSVRKEIENKDPHFFVENLSSPNVNLLKLLGVRNSSVFLSNSTLWVEGISDRIYIRKFIELYCVKNNVKLVEDLDYAFIEYGGGTLPHWSFDVINQNNGKINSHAISNRIFVIADKDDTAENPKGAKALRLKEIKSALGAEHFHLTGGREIENLTTTEILLKVITARGDTVKKDINLEEIEKQKKDVYLGQFIQDNLILGEPKRRYREAKGSGTISEKPTFAEEVCLELKDYDDLSSEAKKLTSKIINFVQQAKQ